MEIFKDAQNKIHEIDEGYEHLLPTGCVQIGAAEAQAMRDAANPPPSAAQIRAANVKKVDTDVDAIYVQVIGSRATEYSEAEAQAVAFAAAGYTGTIPAFVANWLTNNTKGLTTAQAAADDIIAQANAWRGAASAMRTNRLLAKKNIATDVPTAMAQWNGFVVAIRGQLGI